MSLTKQKRSKAQASYALNKQRYRLSFLVHFQPAVRIGVRLRNRSNQQKPPDPPPSPGCERTTGKHRMMHMRRQLTDLFMRLQIKRAV
ncbi:hypothetical protein BaRGS_00035580 [Batillaria attramentaria]|uniref:Uncharacterized protein n=1 Tax=Batillaria attramentaria TaxID=370345 RepID=A0ABD0JE82_9CAEN